MPDRVLALLDTHRLMVHLSAYARAPITLLVESYTASPLIVALIVDIFATTIVFVQSYRYKYLIA